MVTHEQKLAAQRLGEMGERVAADWYERAGFQIVARNWQCFEGELDIVARKGRTTVICEVKTRASDRFIDPALAVSRAKQAKVRTAAHRWLEQHRPGGRLRFDVALVVNGQLQVLEAAF